MTGRVIAGRYNLQHPIGRGALGVVWRAHDELLDRDVAVREVLISSALIGADEQRNAYQRTLREARIAARLSHRGVVPIYDVVEEDGHPWIVMQFVPSQSLDQMLVAEGRLSPGRAGRIGQQLLSALAAAHSAGVLHRDVKPSSVLIATSKAGEGLWEERAVLTDFGIAPFEGNPYLTRTTMLSDSAFVAPERIRGSNASPTSDLWSLGATIYAAVEGRGPFEQRGGAMSTMFAIVQEDAPIARHAGQLAPVIAALLRRDPATRPSASAVAGMFEQVLPHLSESTDEQPATSRPVTVRFAYVPPSDSVVSAPGRPGPGSAGSGDGRSSGGRPPEGSDADSTGQHGRRRYLRAQCPESIPVGEPFSMLASIVLSGPGSTLLKSFNIQPAGQDVLLVAHAPGLRLLSSQRLTVHVPGDRDSEPVMFEFLADAAGPTRVSITAWLSGTYLGELVVEITAEHRRPRGPHRDAVAEIATEPSDGAVSLVVRYDPVQKAYRFEFRDQDNPEEVTSHLAYEPAPLVERLVFGLDQLAQGRSGYSAAETHDYLVNEGARLWRELIPARLREQFWERQHRIRQLTILTDKDAVPWELLYPMDPGHDAGFLVEQFPVTRAVFGRLPARQLSFRPARFVLPQGSPAEAHAEIETLRQMLCMEHTPNEAVISELSPLLDLIRGGDFGLLHFACHNSFDAISGSSIMLDRRQFTPTLMTTAAIGRNLARTSPTIFINACRSAGVSAAYNRLDGWAATFLEAGAAAFIGSLWAVGDTTAREFAEELYKRLQRGSPLGEAITQTRRMAATKEGDPTWLAYAVYGDSRARLLPPSEKTESLGA